VWLPFEKSYKEKNHNLWQESKPWTNSNNNHNNNNLYFLSFYNYKLFVTNFTWVFQPVPSGLNWPIMLHRPDLEHHWLTNTINLTLKMTSTQVVQTSVTNISSFQHHPHPDDHTIQTTDTPGLKPFTMIYSLWEYPWKWCTYENFSGGQPQRFGVTLNDLVLHELLKFTG